MSSNQNSLRRRRQQNQNSASIYASNGDSNNTTSTASNNNNNFPRSIKIRYSGDPNNNNNINHLNSTSISSDRNIGLGNTNNLNLNSQAYDSPFISTDGIAFSSNFIQSDPNEPLYCTCRQVSFGEMIACDGENCPIEWYHLECVNLKAVPEGRWYCDQCIGTQKKRKRGRPVGS
nr:13397_t:CDS:2 [Entrophospora candida]CAG8481216.1 11043_t:CDS:2 [Entrophospora candida]